MRATIIRLYEEHLFRTPSTAEVDSWIALKMPSEAIEERMLASAERKTRTAVVPGPVAVTLAVDPSDDTALRIQIEEGLFNWKLLLSQIQVGDVVADLGAHQGIFTAHAAARGATVLAVEAGSINAQLLRHTARMNPNLDVRVHHCAAWFEKTTLGFTQNRAWGMVDERSETRVPAERTDDLVGDLLDKVRCVKMDVEGAEPHALRGMPELLKRGVDILYETNDYTLNLLGFDIRSPRKILADAGYTSYLAHEGAIYRLREDDSQPTVVADCIALRGDPKRLGVPVNEPMSDKKLVSEMIRLINLPQSREFVRREISKRPDLATAELRRVI